MAELFADLPEALANTAVIARRCSHVLTARTPILPRVPDTGGRSDAEVLAERAERGLTERLDRHVFTTGMTEGERREQGGRYADRLQRELEIIRETGYDGYFLIVGEVMNWSREQGIPVGPGRGSGAGSVVAWALGITDVDPLRFGLLFERFLNPERVSMPDFDLDFCQQRREEVIAHVRELYGDDRVAQIITFGSLKARAVVRDVGRTLGLSYSKVDELAKQVPENPANPISLSEALQSEPGLQEARATDGDVERLFEIALALEGLNRNVSTHAAGLVIGDRPIEELVPLYRDPRSEIAATQYDMKRVEQAGLVKFDFLGLKTLTSMDLAVRLLRERGTELDLEALPLDDEATYALLTSGETGGIFQLESPMMREVLRRLQPNRIEDLVAILALYRPGPMDNIPSFIERRRGREVIAYPHEKLRDILEETSGIWVYQEQVMETAQVLAGFSLGEADILRRAMGKKIKSEMQALETDFVDRSVRNQVPREVAVDIFADLEKFAGYGFNKSHAVAYALISYRTAYLKAHHPADFFAAMMTIESGNRDKLNLFHDEITSRGISLLPPDINRSRTEFTVEAMNGNQPAVRCGLGTLRGVGNAAMDVVVNERNRAGRFTDLWDLARRSRKAELNKEHFENLAEGGALDGLLAGLAQDRARAVAHAAAQMAARCGQEAATEERLSQSSLFGDEASAQELWVLPEAEAWDRSEMLAREFAVLGFYGSGHPLEQHAQQLAAMHAVPLRRGGQAGGGYGIPGGRGRRPGQGARLAAEAKVRARAALRCDRRRRGHGLPRDPRPVPGRPPGGDVAAGRGHPGGGFIAGRQPDRARLRPARGRRPRTRAPARMEGLDRRLVRHRGTVRPARDRAARQRARCGGGVSAGRGPGGGHESRRQRTPGPEPPAGRRAARGRHRCRGTARSGRPLAHRLTGARPVWSGARAPPAAAGR